jgi:hypothetical protein
MECSRTCDISPELIKYGGNKLIVEVTKHFCQAWEEKSIPKDWNINVIVPIFKKGNSNYCSNYRAICLSPVVSKIYTRILEMRLQEIVEPELEEEQGAYRPLCQTQDHIYSIRTICEKFIDKGKDVYFAFLDVKAAFDLIPRQVIWEALAEIYVPEALTQAIKSTFTGVKGVVRINRHSSNPFDIERGVKQGDSMSPLLFIIVTDAILKICKRRTPRMRVGFWNMQHAHAQSLLFADDIVLIADTEEKLQKSVIEWTHEVERKGMELNEKKSKVMKVNKKGEGNINIQCKGEMLEHVDSYTYLGTVISQDGRIDQEAANRVQKANSAYFQMNNIIFGLKRIRNENQDPNLSVSNSANLVVWK